MVAYLNSRPLSSDSRPLCIWWALNSGETNKENKAPNQQGGSGLKGICWAQFPDRCSYDSCLSKLTLMAH